MGTWVPHSLIKLHLDYVLLLQPYKMPLSEKVSESLKKTVDRGCVDSKSDNPGVSIAVVSRDSKRLFAHATGQRGVSTSDRMTLDNGS